MARDLRATSTEDLLLSASSPPEGGVWVQAVGELVMRYKGLVYSQALQICGGNHALADEVFQETFVRLFNWLRTRQNDQTLHTFPKLISVFTKRTAIDIMRRERHHTPTAPMERVEEIPAEQEPTWETKAYVLALLDSLDDRSQEIIRLTYFDDLSAVEIADKLGLKPGHVRTLRFRALELLRALKERDEMADLIEPL